MAATGESSNGGIRARIMSSQLRVVFGGRGTYVHVEETNEESEKVVGNQRLVQLMFSPSYTGGPSRTERDQTTTTHILRLCKNSVEMLAQENLATPTGWRGLPEITRFLHQGPPRLLILYLGGMTGTVQAFHRLAQSLVGVPNLKGFALMSAHIEGMGEDDQACLDPLLDGLMASQELRVLTLGSSLRYVSLPTLLTVINSETLKSLTLGAGHDVLKDEYVVSITRAIKSSRIPYFGVKLNKSMSVAASGKALSQMLQFTKTLKGFIVYMHSEASVEVLLELLDGLGLSCVEHVRFLEPSLFLNPWCQEALVRMAHRNFFLQALEIPGDIVTAENDVKVRFYIELNKSRRPLFLSGRATADWIDALAKSIDRVDHLYYYLSSNPSLCCLPKERQPLPLYSTMNLSRKRKRKYRAAKYTVASYRYN